MAVVVAPDNRHMDLPPRPATSAIYAARISSICWSISVAGVPQ